MTDYAWGVLTPFLALAALALAVGVAWLLIALARHLWGTTHYALMGSVKIAKNRARLRLKGGPPDERPEYLESANKFRDALLQAPRMFMVAGLGWRVLFVRDTRTEYIDDEGVSVEETVDTDEFLA